MAQYNVPANVLPDDPDELGGANTNEPNGAPNLEINAGETFSFKFTSAPAPFRGNPTEDIVGWLQKLDNYGDLNSLNHVKKGQLLSYLLEDAARTWFFDQPEVDRKTYDQQRALLLDRYSSDAIDYIRENTLLERKQGPTESVASYAKDFHRLSSLIGRDYEDRKNLFIRGLRPALAEYTLLARPATLVDAEELAYLREIVANRQKETEKAIKTPQKADSVKEDQVKKLQQDVQALKLDFQDADKRPPMLRTTTGLPCCRNCGLVGHNERSCSPSYGNASTSRLCFGCGSPSHLQKNCYVGQRAWNVNRPYSDRRPPNRFPPPVSRPMEQRYTGRPNVYRPPAVNYARQRYEPRPGRFPGQPPQSMNRGMRINALVASQRDRPSNWDQMLEEAYQLGQDSVNSTRPGNNLN